MDLEEGGEGPAVRPFACNCDKVVIYSQCSHPQTVPVMLIRDGVLSSQ